MPALTDDRMTCWPRSQPCSLQTPAPPRSPQLYIPSRRLCSCSCQSEYVQIWKPSFPDGNISPQTLRNVRIQHTEVRYSQGDNATAVARYTVAVDRRFKRDGEPTADFIPCVVFGRSAEFAEKYFRQGMRVSISGRIQTGSYTNKDGVRVYTTEVIVEEQEFAESRAESEANRSSFQQSAPAPAPSAPAGDGFMNIPDGIDEELPFN